MSYVDMAYLKKTDIRNGVIHYRRRKTGQYLEISLTRELKSILSFFSPFVKGSPYLFPVIRSKEKERVQYENGLRLQNHYLKKLTHTLGLSAPLSTHVARHTWATIAKKEYIPLAVISEALGHNSQKTTQIYLASLDNRILDEANLKIARAIKKVG